MAGIKLTEKDVAEEVKSSAKILITQPEGEEGSEIESVRRANIEDVVGWDTSKHSRPYIARGAGTSGTIENGATESSGSYAHAEGYKTTASGNYGSHAEGNYTTASYDCAHAEGGHTSATRFAAHAEGSYTTASAQEAHAEGYYAEASGNASHSEGSHTEASGGYSHAEGASTVASGMGSHAQNLGTIANHKSQTAFGEWNIADTSANTVQQRGDYIEIVGNGADKNNRSNARTLDWSGNMWIAGKMTVGAGPTNAMDVPTKQYVDGIRVRFTDPNDDGNIVVTIGSA